MLQPVFTPFPEFKTERLLLRRLLPADAEEIFILRSDEEVLRYLGKEPMTSISEASAFIEKINKAVDENESILWGLCMASNAGRVIGTICLWNFKNEHYRAEIGFVLHPAFWRRGIMKEAIRCVADYGFTRLQLHSLEALLSAGNAGSAAVLESCGFAREGHLKENFYFRGAFSDTLIYSKLNPVS